MKGCIFDIQRFSLDDGPGIRTVFFLKGCQARCPWCHNPESLALKPVILHKESRCTRCGRCLNACEYGAVYEKNGGYAVDHARCRACGACEESCFSGACQLSGRYYTPEEVLEQAKKDMAYYEESGGGVTFSGGEPSLQAEFLLECLKLCKESAIRTAIETNGAMPLSVYEALAPYLDAVLIDLKTADDEKSKAVIGIGTENTLAALRMFAKRGGIKVEARTPVIPGFNATAAEIEAIAEIADESGAEIWRLLPYHTYGIGKYASLGMEYEHEAREAMDNEAVRRLLEGVSVKNITVRVSMD